MKIIVRCWVCVGYVCCNYVVLEFFLFDDNGYVVIDGFMVEFGQEECVCCVV